MKGTYHAALEVLYKTSCAAIIILVLLKKSNFWGRRKADSSSQFCLIWTPNRFESRGHLASFEAGRTARFENVRPVSKLATAFLRLRIESACFKAGWPAYIYIIAVDCELYCTQHY